MGHCTKSFTEAQLDVTQSSALSTDAATPL